MDRQKIAGILDRLQARLPMLTRRIGWGGVILGPALGFLHIAAMLFVPSYGRRALGQYDNAVLTSNLLGGPLVHYLILLGFALCLGWLVLWGLRLALAIRSRLASRWSERSV